MESTLQTIEFTPNVTPTTFTEDTPPPLQPSAAYIFPPEEEPFANENPKPRGRKGSGYIPRPPNAFILFRSSFIKSQHVTSEVETNHSTLSKIIGMTWQNLPNCERQAWHMKAKEAQEEHKRKWPQYSFRPVTNKAQKKKRRVRETEPKDIKRCEKIVELLCNGKKGDELKYAVKDFDKSHVPEFVTRFEAPITERAYRRSSSAPLPDTDYEQSKQSFKPSVLPHRKRSSSVEPEDLSPAVEIKLPTSGLAQFDTVPSFDSSPSPGHSTPLSQRDGYIVRLTHLIISPLVRGFFSLLIKPYPLYRISATTLSADQLFPNRSIRSHIPSQASLLLPHPTSLLTSVNSFPHASRTHDCRSRPHSSSSGLAPSRHRLPRCQNLPRTTHQAHLAHRKRSRHLTRASHRHTADSNNSSNNQARNHTITVPRRRTILT